MASASSPPAPPTRTRHVVVLFAVTLAVITYIDRICISQAAPSIMRELHLSKQQMGLAFAVFAWAYSLFEIPGGWMGDWLGPRRVLLRVVTWWSFFTAAMGWIWNLNSAVVFNFLFGAGEAGCFPNLTKVFSTWLPQRERVRAQGIMWMSARWGGAFTPLLVVWILHYMSWRWTFQVFGVLGIVWAFFFYRWFRDNPRDHPGVNAAELALLAGSEKSAAGHGDVPWARLIATPSIWLLWVQYLTLSYTFWFFVTWLPTYLLEHRHLSGAYAAWLASFPLFFGGLGCVVSGFISPRVARWMGGVARGRRFMGCLGCLGAAVLLYLHSGVENAFLAMLMMGMASFSNDLVVPNAWASCMDVGGKYAGTVSGSMNMMGNLGGGIAPVTVGYILQTTGNWTLAFNIMAGAYIVGAVSWLFIDPVTQFTSRTRVES